MYRRGIVANEITYYTLIHGFFQVGNINGALDIFQEMISSGVCPDTNTVRNMLTGLWSKEEVKKAVAMLEDPKRLWYVLLNTFFFPTCLLIWESLLPICPNQLIGCVCLFCRINN